MALPFATLDHVPIVGLQLKAFDGCVMATIQCQCERDNPPLLIRGTDLLVVCQRCHTIYGITRVEFDRAKGPVLLRVEVASLGKHNQAALEHYEQEN